MYDELAAQAAQQALNDLVAHLTAIAKSPDEKTEDRLHAVNLLLLIAQLDERE